jgi:hypothetical protein
MLFSPRRRRRPGPKGPNKDLIEAVVAMKRRNPRWGRTLAPAIEDGQLMPDQHGFGDNRTESTRPCQSGQGDDQMNEYDSEVAHLGNGINTSKTTALRPVLQFAIDRQR